MRKFLMLGALVAGALSGAKALALPEPFYLFSQVRGVVHLNGEPLAGVEVERIYQWKKDRASDRTTTDQSGRFSLPEVAVRSLFWSIYPHQPYISQWINFYHDGRKYSGWLYSKNNYDNQGEMKGRDFTLFCDLKNPELPHVDTEHYGVCSVVSAPASQEPLQ